MELSKNYAQERQRIYEEDGRKYPAKALVEMELRPGYDRTKRHLLAHIKSINEAHLVMLCEQGILTREDSATIMRAIEEIDYDAYAQSEYDGAASRISTSRWRMRSFARPTAWAEISTSRAAATICASRGRTWPFARAN